MRVLITRDYKSIPAGVEFDVPDFCVLTGKNGSGKSHILEAMSYPEYSKFFIDDVELQSPRVAFIGMNGLVPKIEDRCDSMQLADRVEQWWSQIRTAVERHGYLIRGEAGDNNALFEILSKQEGKVLSKVVEKIIGNSGKSFLDLTRADVSRHLDFIDITSDSMFVSKFAMIFKAYHTKQVRNEFDEFRASKYSGSEIGYLSQLEFVEKYGPPPWDLVNDIFDYAGLPYYASCPDLDEVDLQYVFQLVDKNSGTYISVNDLSSGEKVIMSLALAIYNTEIGAGRPHVLLLDEPDAPLHPQYSKLLIEVLIKTVVKKAGVKVIITTHSPSTVAMAPDNCVFEIGRDARWPRLVSNAHAVRTLTEGIDFLRVSFESRRPVFVEHKNDVQYYQMLFNLLVRRHQFSFQPIFLEPHSGTSNCTDVIDIVTKLRSAGNDLVWGIIDSDTVNETAGALKVLGEGTRYAIENYVLDPLYVCLSLIRVGRKKYSDYGIADDKVTYTDAGKLTQQECQAMVDSFLHGIGIAKTDLVKTRLENGFELEYPKSFLFHHGHKYEDKIKDAYIELKAIMRGGSLETSLKLGVLQTIGEYPQFLPVEISETFLHVLGGDT